MKNEQDILNILKEKMEEVEVPESLSPTQIEKKLLEMNLFPTIRQTRE